MAELNALTQIPLRVTSSPVVITSMGPWRSRGTRLTPIRIRLEEAVLLCKRLKGQQVLLLAEVMHFAGATGREERYVTTTRGELRFFFGFSGLFQRRLSFSTRSIALNLSNP